ncbi:MAG: hypothetical protein GTN71_26510 [Anaerolineae bacterium]|nr:hypothetical protein [Anaerolineae bacterium]
MAQLCTYLLTRFHRNESDIIHVYPSKPQIPIGIERLERRLTNPWTSGPMVDEKQTPTARPGLRTVRLPQWAPRCQERRRYSITASYH